MGAFAGREDVRLRMLEDAAKSGADWIDLEHDACVDMIAPLREAGAKVLLSWHSPAETPGRKILRAKLESMCKPGADALKIVTMAQSDEDNLRVLELIPLARKELGVDLIAFCMGPAGKMEQAGKPVSGQSLDLCTVCGPIRDGAGPAFGFRDARADPEPCPDVIDSQIE